MTRVRVLRRARIAELAVVDGGPALVVVTSRIRHEHSSPRAATARFVTLYFNGGSVFLYLALPSYLMMLKTMHLSGTSF